MFPADGGDASHKACLVIAQVGFGPRLVVCRFRRLPSAFSSPVALCLRAGAAGFMQERAGARLCSKQENPGQPRKFCKREFGT